MTHDVIILGAGAAGLFCAATAPRAGAASWCSITPKSPARNPDFGGGRCNFTNLHTAPDRYLSENPHFARSALSRYTPADFLALVEAHGIAWHEKTLGQLFCDGSARQIVDMLLDECRGGAQVRCNSPIRSAPRRWPVPCRGGGGHLPRPRWSSPLAVRPFPDRRHRLCL
jgi:predicted flavoprotein YhiN